MSIGIYSILNTSNGKIYIGQSRDIEKRWSNHKSALRNNHHKSSHLQSAWNKYGEDAFEFNILENCSKEDLNDNEDWWVDYFDATNRDKGYNLESGGKYNYHIRDETRKKMSDAKKGENHQYFGVYGKNHPRYGKTHSNETKLKMSKSHNSSGYYRVIKMNYSSCKQGFRWGYSYYKNKKKCLISSVSLDKLEEKVKSQGLPWIKLEDI